MTENASLPCTVGIVGAGNIVSNLHLPTLLSMPEVRVAWVVDTDQRKATELGTSFKVPAFAAPADPANLPEAGIVLLAIPYGVREPYYEALRRRTTALYVEKPLARTVEQHRRYCDWFSGSRLAVGYQRRAWGSAALAKQVLATGALGPLRGIRVHHGRPGQLTGSSYSADFLLAGGGLLFEVGVHWIDLALMVADVRSARIESGRMLRQDQFDVHTEARFTAETASGPIPLELAISGLAETRNVLEFLGDHATLVLHQGDGRLTLERDGRPLDVELTGRSQAYPSTPFQLSHAVWQAVVQAVKSETPNWTSATTSMVTTEVVEAVYGLPP